MKRRHKFSRFRNRKPRKHELRRAAGERKLGGFEQLESRRLLALAAGINPFTEPPFFEQGPNTVFGGQVEGIQGKPVAGAVDAIAIHPDNPNMVLVGSVNGGVWRSTNARVNSDGVDNDMNGSTDGDGSDAD